MSYKVKFYNRIITAGFTKNTCLHFLQICYNLRAGHREGVNMQHIYISKIPKKDTPYIVKAEEKNKTKTLKRLFLYLHKCNH